jgi:hypothetical protein
MTRRFHVERTALLWSMITKGKLDEARTPYWRFEAHGRANSLAHPARAFPNWFD